jgi:DNA-binding response OmpR family regulator/tetratricopeptide (TPR) repeat protein
MAKTILIIDDEFPIYKLVGTFLNVKGYQTIWAKNGEEGYEKFMEELPDMVCVDVLMPKMNGPDCVKKIRGRHEGKQVPIVMMTSIEKSFSLQRDAVNKWGANAFLQKPFELEDLLKLVHQFIGEEETGEEKVTTDVSQDKGKGVHGSLEEKSYAKLIHLLYKRKATGKLELSSRRRRMTVYFEDGRPVDIKSNYIREGSLGSILEKKYSLEHEVLEKSRKMVRDMGLRQGEALVEMGAITREELAEALREQAEAKMLTPFGWREGNFGFVDGVVIQDPDLLLSLPIPQIILAGLLQHYSTEQIRGRFANRMNRKFSFNYKTPYKIEDFGLNERERSFVETAKARGTIDRVLQASGLPEGRAFKILYAMFLLGMFKFGSEEAETEPAPRKEKPEKARPEGVSAKVIEGDADQLFYEGVNLYKSGDIRGAANRFERAIGLNKKEPKYLAYMAVALLQLPPGSVGFSADPATLIKWAGQMNCDDADTCCGLGLYYKEKKQLSKASGFFSKALEFDPDHADASRELNLMKIARRKDAQWKA